MSVIQPLRHFDGTRDSPRPMTRVERVRDAARELRRDLLSRPKLRFYKSFELVRVPYPSKFGYLNAFAGVSPFLHLCNRLFVIQFDSAEGVKTLLAGPSDWEHQRATPFFADLDAKAGPLSPMMKRCCSRRPPPCSTAWRKSAWTRATSTTSPMTICIRRM